MQLDDFEESDGVTSEGKDIFLFILEKLFKLEQQITTWKHDLEKKNMYIGQVIF